LAFEVIFAFLKKRSELMSYSQANLNGFVKILLELILNKLPFGYRALLPIVGSSVSHARSFASACVKENAG